MSERLPTREEWDAWLALPETDALRRIAAKRRQDMKDAWENGIIIGEQANMMAIGSCKALQLLEDLDYDTAIIGELGDEHGRSPKPSDNLSE